MTSHKCSAIAGSINFVTAENAERHILFPDNAYTTRALSSLNGSPSVGEWARFALLRALEIGTRIKLLMSPGRAAVSRTIRRTISERSVLLRCANDMASFSPWSSLQEVRGHKDIRESLCRRARGVREGAANCTGESRDAGVACVMLSLCPSSGDSGSERRVWGIGVWCFGLHKVHLKEMFRISDALRLLRQGRDYRAYCCIVLGRLYREDRMRHGCVRRVGRWFPECKWCCKRDT